MVRRSFDPLKAHSNRWVLTYADLCTLLLTFFVLLVSMSTIDTRRERKVLDSLVGSFGPMPGGRSITGRPRGTEAMERKPRAISGRTLDLQMLRELNVKNRLESETVQAEKDKTILQISGKILFQPGSTDLNPGIITYLTDIASYLKKNRQEIEIRGHTDLFEGIKDSDWTEESWNVSLKRAQAVYGFFEMHGIDVNRMSCHGYSYYRPVVDSREYPRLSEKNQRVEIVLGPNDSLPASPSRDNRNSSHIMNYKNFFFRLYPPEDSVSDLHEWEKPDIYDAFKAQDQEK